MSQLSKDILIGILFITGLVGFISGEFIISSTLFLASAIASNMNVNRKRTKADQLSWD
jgi:CheY-specific phosphatase CheX